MQKAEILDRQRVTNPDGRWFEIQKFRTRFGAIEWFVVGDDGECYAQADSRLEALSQCGMWLPASAVKDFSPDRYDFRWNDDYSKFVPVRLLWWDDASYAACQDDGASVYNDYMDDGPVEPDDDDCSEESNANIPSHLLF